MIPTTSILVNRPGLAAGAGAGAGGEDATPRVAQPQPQEATAQTSVSSVVGVGPTGATGTGMTQTMRDFDLWKKTSGRGQSALPLGQTPSHGVTDTTQTLDPRETMHVVVGDDLQSQNFTQESPRSFAAIC